MTASGEHAPLRIGILALQGDFEAHANVFARLGTESIFVRQAAELADVDALVLPGGESTTFLKLMNEEGLADAIRKMPAEGRALFGTCAGAILLAKEVTHPAQASLGLLDMTVARNAYGRQIVSRVARGVCSLKENPLEMVFIRAPIIERVGEGVEVLAWCDERPVFVRQGLAMATTFHPELTDDTTVHEYFLRLVSRRAASVRR